MSNPAVFMVLAVRVAEPLLRECHCGFGAVIAMSDQVVARAHDMENTDGDPTGRGKRRVAPAA